MDSVHAAGKSSTMGENSPSPQESFNAGVTSSSSASSIAAEKNDEISTPSAFLHSSPGSSSQSPSQTRPQSVRSISFAPQSPGGSAMTAGFSWQGHTHFAGAPTQPLARSRSSAHALSQMSSPHDSASVLNGTSETPSVEDRARMAHSISTASNSTAEVQLRRRYKAHVSQNLPDGTAIHKPWTEQKSRRQADRKAYWLFLASSCIGLLGAAALVVTGYLSVPHDKYCLVLDEQFTGDSINTNVWFHERQTGGFGTGEFEWVTDSTNNSYVADGNLYIVPTLTSDSVGAEAIVNGYTLNLTSQGTCTSSNTSDTYCAVASNASLGTILPPVQSARLMTNFSTSIKYGRVEVRAKMPRGDWIWPAIWMMPKDSVYGAWPRSGEIDIMESKGNAVKNRNSDGTNIMRSTLHWGPDSTSDRYYKTTQNRRLYRDYFDQEFHTFGLDWTPEGIYTWEESPVHKVLSYNFGSGFWKEGNFPTVSSNGTAYASPWPENNVAAPFDQEFYLILSVAVGGTNGYFDEENKPWSNNAGNAVNEFWNAKDDWYSTWPEDPKERAMVVDYVKTWNLEGVEGVECPATPL